MGPGDDLDALIGDIRREAARRRAAPDFPLDEEARLSVEMDGQGPAGTGGADLAAITAALRELGRTGDANAAQVAGLAASAVTALSVRLAELERRAVAPRPARSPQPGPPAGAADSPPADRLIGTWGDDVVAAAQAGAGRTLVIGAGEGVDSWVARLSSAGADVYGLDAGGEAFGDRGPVRSGDAVDHLRTVGDGTLGLAAVLSPVPGLSAGAGQLEELARELARAGRRIVVCSEAPWAWRRRVGEAAADTSPDRPLGPEAWLEALASAGVEATGRYDGAGATFMILTAPVARAAG